MSKRALVVVAAMAAVLFSGCSGSSSVSQDEAEEAFLVGFTSVMMASFSAAFGDAPEGVVLSDDMMTMELQDFDISEVDDVEYTAVSGKVENVEGVMKCDLQLTGGPVETLIFEITDVTNMDGIDLTAIVNGSEMQIEISEEELYALRSAS